MEIMNEQIDVPVAYEVQPSIQEEQYYYVGEVRIPILQIEKTKYENKKEFYYSFTKKVCQILIFMGCIFIILYFA